MKIFSQDLMSAIKNSESSSAHYVRFSVYGYYLDDQLQEQTTGVTVTITATGYTQVSNYIDVPIGTLVTYSVSKQGHQTEGPFYCTVTGSATRSVKLTSLPMWTFNVVPTPADSTVSMASGQYTSNTGSIEVPQGSTVTYSISHASMNSYSGSRMIPASSADTDPVTIERILTSTISIESVSPADATISWMTGTGDASSGLSCTAYCTNTVSLTITKTGYDTINRSYPESGDYLLNTNLGAITMTKKALTCTQACNDGSALIEMWKEVNGVEVAGSKVQGYSSVTINCVMGDEIHWRVSRQNYNTQTGVWTMGTEDKVLPPVTLIINNYVVSISSSPNNAIVKIYRDTTELASGTGAASVGVDAGTYVTYTASLGGVTASGKATVNANYSDTLTLSATSDGAVTILTSTQTINLPYGKYKFVLVGGGAGGRTPYSGARYGARTASGGRGAGGGGSGYVTIANVMISNTSGQNVSCVVGTGGGSNSNGNATSITIGSTSYTADGGKVGYSSTYNEATYRTYGGDGGSAGGAGGCAPTTVSGQAGYSATNGGRGSYGGGNGETMTTSYSGATVTHNGGTGYYSTTKSYESNAGAKKTTVQNGNPGGGGRGLVSISTTLTNTSTFSSLSNVQTLYNAMGGGGGGGPTGVPTSSTSVYGGPGGGGGGWYAGSAGTAGAPGTGGSGGAGAILYMRIAWS